MDSAARGGHSTGSAGAGWKSTAQAGAATAGASGGPDDEVPPYPLFADKQKPQRYARGQSKVHPTTPLDPIRPYMAGPVPRRRKSEWPVLLFAMIVAAIVMAFCCIAGFAIFRTYGFG